MLVSLKENRFINSKNFNIMAGGASAGLYFYPLSRLYLSANGSIGVHNININSPSVTSDSNGLYYRGFGELGFRFTPSLILNAVGGYEDFKVDGESLISGTFVGLGAKFNFSTGKKASSGFSPALRPGQRVEVVDNRLRPVCRNRYPQHGAFPSCPSSVRYRPL